MSGQLIFFQAYHKYRDLLEDAFSSVPEYDRQKIKNDFDIWVKDNNSHPREVVKYLRNKDKVQEFVQAFYEAGGGIQAQQAPEKPDNTMMPTLVSFIEKHIESDKTTQDHLLKIDKSIDDLQKGSVKGTKVSIYWTIAASIASVAFGYWLAPNAPTLEQMEKMMENVLKKEKQKAIIEERKGTSSDSSSQEKEGVFDLGNGLVGIVPPRIEITPDPPSKNSKTPNGSDYVP